MQSTDCETAAGVLTGWAIEPGALEGVLQACEGADLFTVVTEEKTIVAAECEEAVGRLWMQLDLPQVEEGLDPEGVIFAQQLAGTPAVFARRWTGEVDAIQAAAEAVRELPQGVEAVVGSRDPGGPRCELWMIAPDGLALAVGLAAHGRAISRIVSPPRAGAREGGEVRPPGPDEPGAWAWGDGEQQ